MHYKLNLFFDNGKSLDVHIKEEDLEKVSEALKSTGEYFDEEKKHGFCINVSRLLYYTYFAMMPSDSYTPPVAETQQPQDSEIAQDDESC